MDVRTVVVIGLVGLGTFGCAMSPPPVTLAHDLPAVDTSGRNHASLAGAFSCASACDATAAPLQASLTRRLGDDLYVGLSQSGDLLSFGFPQTRIIAAIDAADGWLAHTGLGVGWISNSSVHPHYGTVEFGLRRSFPLGDLSLYVDPVAATSFPTFGTSLDPYGFLLANGGLAYRPTETLRLTGGPTLGWAQPLDGASGFLLSTLSIGATYSF